MDCVIYFWVFLFYDVLQVFIIEYFYCLYFMICFSSIELLFIKQVSNEWQCLNNMDEKLFCLIFSKHYG